MNLRVIFAACTIAAFGLSMMTFDALGQKQSLKEQLVGTCCNALASSHGARIHTSRSSSVIRITGIALG